MGCQQARTGAGVLRFFWGTDVMRNNNQLENGPRGSVYLLPNLLLIMVVATKPQITLFFIGVLSILSGPLAGVYRMFDYQQKEVIEKVSVG